MDNDHYINLAEKAVQTGHLITPYAVLESFPFLARLPSWLPFMGFLQEMERSRQLTFDLRNVPWKGAMEQLVRIFHFRGS